MGCPPKVFTAQAQDSSNHHARSQPNTQQANEEPTEIERQKTFDRELMSSLRTDLALVGVES